MSFSAKVKISRKIQLLPKRYEKAKMVGLKNMAAKIKQPILAQISRGRSPVSSRKGGSEGKGIWDQYNEQYSKINKGGKKRPVDMKLSGKMLASLKVRFNRGTKNVSVWFTNEIAKYHDILGAGKSKVIRRLLPRNGEEFTPKLMKAVKRPVLDAIQKALKPYGRK